jgi:serine protease
MLDINSLFDESFYLTQNLDVAQAVASGGLASGFDHFNRFGKFERRDPSALFYTEFYLELHEDVEAAVNNGQLTTIDHFVNFGQREGRDPIPEFVNSFYLETNSDVAAAVAGTTGAPDPLTSYQHFVQFGQFENRDPSPDFESGFYLQRYPDVAAAVRPGGLSAIKHYIQFGLQEGRTSDRPDPDEDLSLATSLGNLVGSKSVSDFIGDGDEEDLYSFTLDTTSAVNISLNGLSSDAQLQLISDLGEDGELDRQDILAKSDAEGTSPEVINLDVVAPGTYSVRVLQASGGTTYTMNVSAAATADPSNRPIPAQPEGFNYYFGRGLVDVQAALSQATGEAVPDATKLIKQDGLNFEDLNLINAETAYARNITGEGIIVAVIDDGVSINHPDLKDNIWVNSGEIAANGIDDDGNGFIDDVNGWNFAGKNNNPNPGGGGTHGTHVAGTIAAEKNGFGTTGVAHKAKIMPLRVFDDKGSGQSSLTTQAIRYAVNNGAKVISMSLGSPVPGTNGPDLNSPYADALRFARDNNVVVVISSGNERKSNFAIQPGEPAFQAAIQFSQELANSGLAIAVGAVDRNRKVADFSNPVGATNRSYPFISAPGVKVASTVGDRGYEYQGGTSMATPHVSGVAALLLQANPNLSVQQVQDILTGTANPNGITV